MPDMTDRMQQADEFRKRADEAQVARAQPPEDKARWLDVAQQYMLLAASADGSRAGSAQASSGDP